MISSFAPIKALHSTARRITWLAMVFCLTLPTLRIASAEETKLLKAVLSKHCLDCHSGASPESGLDLHALSEVPLTDNLDMWIQVHDRVLAGEMPPADYAIIDSGIRKQFSRHLSDTIIQHQQREQSEQGRVRGRRLTRLQLERTLHDLLGIDIPLAAEMPADPVSHGFTTVADGQPMSHFQLLTHVNVVDMALDEAVRRIAEDAQHPVMELSARQLARENPNRRTREPEMLDGDAVVWSGGVTFYGRLPATTASQDGWYRFTAKVSALNCPDDHGVWCSVRTGKCVSSAPLLPFVTAFEAIQTPKQIEFEAWLPRDHMLEIRPADATIKKARFQGGQVGTGEGAPQNVPGLAIHQMTMQRIHRNSDEPVKKKLFGDLVLELESDKCSLRVEDPVLAAEQCIRRFARRAFRQPVSEQTVKPYVAYCLDLLESGTPLLDSLVAGYRAILCSPRFLYFTEEPGRLDDHALASRLSYMLWNRPPDAELMECANAGLLQDSSVIEAQVERMLRHAHGKDFVRDFADEWLTLNQINFTSPDSKLYPEFDLIVQHSMLLETQTFLQVMLDENLGADHLIDAPFTFLNNRLARHYGVDGVVGDELSRTMLEPGHHRGGLLTQGAILKVTANGTTTSPVIRGLWVVDRLLGVDIPPPPKNVPAIEPDIRGAKTIREMLDKHRSDPSCASCHIKMDPAGFALENFDAAGQYREHYVRLENRKRSQGALIDPSYEIADGKSFSSLSEFQELILQEPEQIAANFVRQLLTYGTGAPMAFADRGEVQSIVDEAEAHNFGLRSLVKAVATSELFRTK
ncbi:MAG: DUF1592 domain-containing protein [bacterium]|nr:DUF1592 domain-containing protein [bacterium]